MSEAQMRLIGTCHGVNWYWADPATFGGDECGGVYWHDGERMVRIPNPKPPLIKPKGKCPERNKPGGCQLHNLHCGYPKCDE